MGHISDTQLAHCARKLEEVCDDPEVMEEALRILAKSFGARVNRAIEKAQERARAGQIGAIL